MAHLERWAKIHGILPPLPDYAGVLCGQFGLLLTYARRVDEVAEDCSSVSEFVRGQWCRSCCLYCRIYLARSRCPESEVALDLWSRKKGSGFKSLY